SARARTSWIRSPVCADVALSSASASCMTIFRSSTSLSVETSLLFMLLTLVVEALQCPRGPPDGIRPAADQQPEGRVSPCRDYVSHRVAIARWCYDCHLSLLPRHRAGSLEKEP